MGPERPPRLAKPAGFGPAKCNLFARLAMTTDAADPARAVAYSFAASARVRTRSYFFCDFT